MKRTRWIFVGILVVVALIIGVAIVVQRSGNDGNTPDTELVLEQPETITVRVLTALPVEPWVRSAAETYNATQPTLDGVPIQVEIIPMDGLTALGRWDRNDFGALGADADVANLTAAEKAALASFPTVWIPDSRYLVELANASYKERLGRDVFLTDGEYRARPIAISLFTWGIYESRANVLTSRFGDITWNAIHDAAVAKGGWPELGGDPAWGFFKLVVPNPNKNAGGLAAMVAAAGEYYGRTDISVADLTEPQFQTWLKELMGSVTDFSSASAYTAEDFALFGYSVGDGGQLLESDLLQNMQGILTRWDDPLKIYYPRYVTWFEFPYTIWVGPETSALEKNAALAFQRFLLGEEQQKAALAYGLRPTNPNVSLDATPESLFVKWKDRGVEMVVPRSDAMRNPDREVLLALLRWFELNVAN
ncbi:MAG TPA: substrate-binding domain-containing protein [Anaerolineae bacterium]|nr:substrate-binding domain-containing protein [Anaerolineae bacterium]HQH37356.1 substrate-binding domain-containing protein [Anaerolineae bacterium]